MKTIAKPGEYVEALQTENRLAAIDAAKLCREQATKFRDFAKVLLSNEKTTEFARTSAECMKLRAEGCDVCAEMLEKP